MPGGIGLADRRGGAAQQVVAGHVAVNVVDLLEAIEVDHQRAERIGR